MIDPVYEARTRQLATARLVAEVDACEVEALLAPMVLRRSTGRVRSVCGSKVGAEERRVRLEAARAEARALGIDLDAVRRAR